jgi:hypothetical protein
MTLAADPARTFVLLLMLAIGMLPVGSASAQGPTRAGRIPWTTSRFVGTPDPPPPYEAVPAFPKLTFDRPVLLGFVPGTDRLVVAELGGKIVSFPNDSKADQVDVALNLATARPGMAAVYGLAFHPKFEANGFVYICYVTRNDIPDGSRVSRFKVREVNPLTIDPASEEIVLTFPSGGHNGGCLAFGLTAAFTSPRATPQPPTRLTHSKPVRTSATCSRPFSGSMWITRTQARHTVFPRITRLWQRPGRVRRSGPMACETPGA